MSDTLPARRANFSIDSDPARLQMDVIHDYLANRSYWAQGRPRELVEKSIRHSFNFGLYDGDRQVGFARVVTDYATFAWLCDVFVLEDYRGQGLAKWLVQTVVEHPDLSGLRRMLLVTRDAHELYRGYGGFRGIERPEALMQRVKAGNQPL